MVTSMGHKGGIHEVRTFRGMGSQKRTPYIKIPMFPIQKLKGVGESTNMRRTYFVDGP